MEWIFLGIGVFVGAFIGIVTMCILIVGKDSDD